jgi:hypothetical protein
MIRKSTIYFSLSLILPLTAYADKFEEALELCKEKISKESSKLSIDNQYALLDKFFTINAQGKARLCIARHKVLPRKDKAAFIEWLKNNDSN